MQNRVNESAFSPYYAEKEREEIFTNRTQTSVDCNRFNPLNFSSKTPTRSLIVRAFD